ncbi:hypothetical protein F8A10_12045 [Paracoccus kondratievae]|uniref:hypothetical protein n=1 Tax=Paracoccus kondratievae TaxID=135740 RepID=UPI0012662A39|nr:hypothetical protein [Paracoccus kondratievae]QFQ88242.1 hypothetical protein F8A10_12045 [Paracoccus kondratievae]
MTPHSNVVTFPATFGPMGELPAEQLQEIRDIGFTHYRHVEDDLMGKMAILRAACLILSDLALADPDPVAGLDACLADLRAETANLIRDMQSE